MAGRIYVDWACGGHFAPNNYFPAASRRPATRCEPFECAMFETPRQIRSAVVGDGTFAVAPAPLSQIDLS
jgi:hypothetical protein